jgi:hypothetical protein
MQQFNDITIFECRFWGKVQSAVCGFGRQPGRRNVWSIGAKFSLKRRLLQYLLYEQFSKMSRDSKFTSAAARTHVNNFIPL